MDKFTFIQSLQSDEPPVSISEYAMALWYDAKGQWDKAHEIVQDIEDQKAARLHAYLHRKEGDIYNADYWYRRSGTTRPHYSLQEEWEQLLSEILWYIFITATL